jgi:hypothetical protein
MWISFSSRNFGINPRIAAHEYHGVIAAPTLYLKRQGEYCKRNYYGYIPPSNRLLHSAFYESRRSGVPHVF